MINSRVTSKYQATIPSDIRDILKLGRGDSIAFSITDGKVVLEKVQPVDANFLRMLDRTLSEWNSPEDDDAFKDLRAIGPQFLRGRTLSLQRLAPVEAAARLGALRRPPFQHPGWPHRPGNDNNRQADAVAPRYPP